SFCVLTPPTYNTGQITDGKAGHETQTGHHGGRVRAPRRGRLADRRRAWRPSAALLAGLAAGAGGDRAGACGPAHRRAGWRARSAAAGAAGAARRAVSAGLHAGGWWAGLGRYAPLLARLSADPRHHFHDGVHLRRYGGAAPARAGVSLWRGRAGGAALHARNDPPAGGRAGGTVLAGPRGAGRAACGARRVAAVSPCGWAAGSPVRNDTLAHGRRNPC